MIYRNTLIADNFPLEFESSNIQIPDGQRASFEKLASSKFARVLRCNVFFGAKVYSLILKQYFNRNIFDFFKALIFSSRAEKAFNAGQMLMQNGFLVPPAVAYNEKTLVTLEVKNSTPLCQLLSKCPSFEKQKILEQFGQTIGRMHDKGIFHGDLRLGNVLVKNNYDFIFLDNERTKKLVRRSLGEGGFDNLPWRLRIKNIVQIYMNRENITDDDRKVFFESYLSQQQSSIDGNKLAEQVTSKTAKRLAKKMNNPL